LEQTVEQVQDRLADVERRLAEIERRVGAARRSDRGASTLPRVAD
jgi:hypothetical protein